MAVQPLAPDRAGRPPLPQRPGPGARGRPVPAGRAKRPPWWVLGLGMLGLVGWTGWVAAQPLPPPNGSPAVRSVDGQIQQADAAIQNLSAQARQWQAQRSAAAAALQQAQASLGLGGGAVSGGSGTGAAGPDGGASVPAAPSFAVTRGS